VFERGDKLFLTTPLTLCSPSAQAIEEFAFSSAVKSMAPNENIGWVRGRYVESGRANLNNVMWLNEELAVKSLTPMLMPVTVMHDPRTAVGTIADCRLTGDNNNRIDTILAVWRHRFPDVWDEVQQNIESAEMMQSMECFSPLYDASCDCGRTYVKLAEGAERASWCSHLKSGEACRILRDVCFTGTGLIFGSRGSKGAYTEAYLDNFQEEIAEYHARAHVDSSYRPSGRSSTQMGVVQIEESELAQLRKEREEAKAKVDTQASEVRELTTKVEKAEAEKVKAEETAKDSEKKLKESEEKAQAASLKETRVKALGDGFLAKLGEFTRGRLEEAAGALDDSQWEEALKEKEEMAGVKRDAKANSSTTTENAPSPGTTENAGSVFANEEIARFMGGNVQVPPTSVTGADGVATSRKLANAFKKPVPTGAGDGNGNTNGQGS
jgi:hypothetical protein